LGWKQSVADWRDRGHPMTRDQQRVCECIEVNSPLLPVLSTRIRFAEARVPRHICGQIDELAKSCLRRFRSSIRGHLRHQRSANHSENVTYGSSIEIFRVAAVEPSVLRTQRTARAFVRPGEEGP